MRNPNIFPGLFPILGVQRHEIHGEKNCFVPSEVVFEWDLSKSRHSFAGQIISEKSERFDDARKFGPRCQAY
jgi:hypothetical protein